MQALARRGDPDGEEERTPLREQAACVRVLQGRAFSDGSGADACLQTEPVSTTRHGGPDPHVCGLGVIDYVATAAYPTRGIPRLRRQIPGFAMSPTEDR